MFLPKGTTLLITSLAFAASEAVGKVASVDVDPSSTGEFLPKHVPYDNGGTTTLLVSYSDEKGHDNVVSHTKKMKGQGKSVSEKKNFKLKTKHKVKKKDKSSSSPNDKKGAKSEKIKDDKDRKLNLFHAEKDNDAYISGFSVIEVESDDVAAEIAALSALPGVATVEEDAMMHILSTDYDKKKKKLRGQGGVAEHVREIQDSIKTTADEIGDVSSHGERRLAEETPYGIGMVNAEYVWDKGIPPSTIKICVVDTGYDLGHEDLPTDGVAGWNDPSGQFDLWDEDGNGHGTHCAGTIGAIGNNDIGVTSVNPYPDRFTFFIGKGLSNSGSGSNANVLNAVEKCVENGAKVISMSLGCDGTNCYSNAANAVYEQAYDSGGELRSTVSAYCNAQPSSHT